MLSGAWLNLFIRVGAQVLRSQSMVPLVAGLVARVFSGLICGAVAMARGTKGFQLDHATRRSATVITQKCGKGTGSLARRKHPRSLDQENKSSVMSLRGGYRSLSAAVLVAFGDRGGGVRGRL